MQPDDSEDLKRVKALLDRTGEFIAYFELAESKMLEWRAALEQKQYEQQTWVESQLSEINEKMMTMQTFLDNVGLSKIHAYADMQKEQAEANLRDIKQVQTEICEQIAQHNVSLQALMNNIQYQIKLGTDDALQHMDAHLKRYDPLAFHRLAHESVEYVNRHTQQSLYHGQKILKTFQWRQMLIAFMITAFTSVTIGLYMNDELPWEHHQTAKIERSAGQMLIKAWPHLTTFEQTKIKGEHEPISS